MSINLLTSKRKKYREDYC